MLDSTEARILPLRPATRRQEDEAPADTLRRECIHPAEAWVLQRRAGRPQPPGNRLPAVARLG